MLIDHIKDILFPVFCLGCDKEGEWLCESCFNLIDKTGVFACPVCHIDGTNGYCCYSCASYSSLDRVLATVIYDEAAPIGKLVKVIKYNHAMDAMNLFKTFFISWIENRPKELSDVDIIVPVPLHQRRLAERGFNQADAIASVIAEYLALPKLRVLRRLRNTKHQARLSKLERADNVRDAFCLESFGQVQGKKILLVDDVYTTGSTLQTCARELRRAGASVVSGFTLARG